MARSIVVWWLAAFVAILLVAHVPLARIAHREAHTNHAGLPPCGPEPHRAPCARHEAETVGAWIGEAALHGVMGALVPDPRTPALATRLILFSVIYLATRCPHC